ncbi:MAG TPA: hypothetical protein VJX95_00150, partial [Oscillospiraceae bacterium]|nr:hypothetical protein [Oscillospiraceae bacterium]
ADPNSSLPTGWDYDQVTEAYTPPPNTTEWTADTNSPIGWKPTPENSLFKKSSAGVWVSKIALPSQWVKSETEYVTKTTLDNSQLLKLLGVFDKKMDFGTSGEFKGTMDSYIDFYTNRLGQQTEFAISQYETSGIMVNNILSSRDSTSSVSMDEEGINMLNYQKWLNASSRMMTTLDEALDMIINKMGVVGR